MKKDLSRIVLTFGFFTLVLGSCKEESPKVENPLEKLSAICDAKPAVAKLSSVTTSSNEAAPYNVSLLQRKDNGDGTYTWIWKITNPNPGNGHNGTVQDLSNWGMSLGDCATISNIVSASSSVDGLKWQSFNPQYKEDTSQDCYKNPILKFDFGTSGGESRYYRLVLNKDFAVVKRTAVYKSGSVTGCGTFEICAIGCVKE